MCKIIIFSGSNFWHFYRNPFSLTVLRAEIWPTFVASVHSHPFNHSFTKWKAIGSPITSAHSAEPSSSSRRQFRFFSFSALQRVALNPTVFISVGLRRLQTVALNNSQDLCKPLFFFFAGRGVVGLEGKKKQDEYVLTLRLLTLVFNSWWCRTPEAEAVPLYLIVFERLFFFN